VGGGGGGIAGDLCQSSPLCAPASSRGLALALSPIFINTSGSLRYLTQWPLSLSLSLSLSFSSERRRLAYVHGRRRNDMRRLFLRGPRIRITWRISRARGW